MSSYPKYKEFQKTGGVHSDTDMKAVKEFSRDKQTEKLAHILNEIVEKKPSSSL